MSVPSDAEVQRHSMHVRLHRDPCGAFLWARDVAIEVEFGLDPHPEDVAHAELLLERPPVRIGEG